MRATARAQPNIALIKYWGKRDRSLNLPAVGSISITLDSLYTEMSVQLDADLDQDRLIVNGHEEGGMLPRVSACLDSVLGPGRTRAHIESRANFPVAAGLASSASAFASVVVAAAEAAEKPCTRQQLSQLAGRASGSAARSLFGGFAELSLLENEVSVRTIAGCDEWPLKVVVAVTSSGEKPLSSGEAMEISRKTSPFYERWVDDQANDLDTARAAIEQRDFDKLAAIAEHNCLKMHSVMWTSRPPIVYWNAATLRCLESVRSLRKQGVSVFFTIDAGPQVKAVCPERHVATVRDALAETPGVKQVLLSGLGEGARLVESA